MRRCQRRRSNCATICGTCRQGNARPQPRDSYLAAIATVHRLHGYRVDRTILIEPLKAARRRAGPQRRARALTRRVLKNLVGRLEAAIARDARDATLMLMGFAGALRGAEIVGLDWLVPSSRLQGGTGFVSLEPDGLLITLNTSKSSQVTPVSLVIRDVDMPSLRLWLNHWLTHADIKAGEPLFRRVTKAQRVMAARLSPEFVGRVIRARTFAYAKSQGKTDTEAYRLSREHSGHSLRRGYCTSASELQLTLGQIRARSRHASDAQLGKYIRSAEVWRHGAGLAKVGF